MEKTHDEQVSELLGYQAEVVMLKRRVDSGRPLTKSHIRNLQRILEALSTLRLALNHYPEVKVSMFKDIKNLLLSA